MGEGRGQCFCGRPSLPAGVVSLEEAAVAGSPDFDEEECSEAHTRGQFSIELEEHIRFEGHLRARSIALSPMSLSPDPLCQPARNSSFSKDPLSPTGTLDD